MEQILIEKLTGPQLVQKFPSVRVTRMFTTLLTSARHLSPSRSQINPDYLTTEFYELQSLLSSVM
jgi:hypothetical protein